ncbi:MAG: hypothetical protein M3016_05720, partial [Actinomycetota bacterium]|nr:hypothetical protein [Actinomycetota bacterium]
NVAGLGGFSGRESSISARWLAMEVRARRLRWIVIDRGRGPGAPGDTRTGSRATMAVASRVCRQVTLGGSSRAQHSTIYDCRGRAAAILAAAGRS